MQASVHFANLFLIVYALYWVKNWSASIHTYIHIHIRNKKRKQSNKQQKTNKTTATEQNKKKQQQEITHNKSWGDGVTHRATLLLSFLRMNFRRKKKKKKKAEKRKKKTEKRKKENKKQQQNKNRWASLPAHTYSHTYVHTHTHIPKQSTKIWLHSKKNKNKWQ